MQTNNRHDSEIKNLKHRTNSYYTTDTYFREDSLRVLRQFFLYLVLCHEFLVLETIGS